MRQSSEIQTYDEVEKHDLKFNSNLAQAEETGEFKLNPFLEEDVTNQNTNDCGYDLQNDGILEKGDCERSFKYRIYFKEKSDFLLSLQKFRSKNQ